MVTKTEDFFNRGIPGIQKDFWDSDDFMSEQLDMFDKLDVALYSADMYAWEADFKTETITRTDLPSGKGSSLTFEEFFDLIDENDTQTLKDVFFLESKEQRRTIDEDIRIRRDENLRWYKLKGTIYRFRKDNIYAAGVAYDIENSESRKERLEYLKTHDALTGLDNFRALDRLSESGCCLYPCAMVIACVDNLREINDSLGYIAGNDLIKNVAEVIKECFCDADFVVRIGGGEFCAVFSGKNDLEIGMKIKEAHMTIHKMYLNLIKTEVSFGYAISNDQNELYGLYKQAAGKMQRNRDLKKILSDETVVDKLNDIISTKAGWGKRNKRLQSLAAQIGSELNCSEEQINEIKVLAKIADLGLIGIPDTLIAGRYNLTDSDALEYIKHIDAGRTLISNINELSNMEGLYQDIYKRYDEWQDGITLSGRIVAGAVCFDDISLRNKSARIKSIISSIEAQKGKRLCPKVVEAIANITTKHLVKTSNG